MDSQIFKFDWGNGPVYALGAMPMAYGGDSTAVNPPAMDERSVVEASFHLIPRQTPAHLEFLLYAQEIPATPAGMAGVLEQLIAAGNYKYRHAVLEFPFARKLVWPKEAVYVSGAGAGAPRVSLQPTNMFPLRISYDATDVMLEVNTQAGVGSVRRVDFDERNVFGFAEHHKTWDEAIGKNIVAKISSIAGLGIRDQQCEVRKRL